MKKLELKVLLSVIDKALAPLNKLTKGGNKTAKALDMARKSLRGLNDQQKSIDGFRKLSRDIATNNTKLSESAQKVAKLSNAIKATENPTRTMQREFNRAVKASSKLKTEHTALITKQQQLRSKLMATGISTSKLASEQRKLKTNMATATAQVDKQTIALKKQAAVAKQLNSAKWSYQKGMQKRNAIAGAGASTGMAGIAMGVPIVKVVRDFGEFETAMINVAKQMQGARDKNGKLTADYFAMSDAIKDMSERMPLSAIQIAELVEGAARMGIDGKKNLLLFTEQAARAAGAFDLPTDRIAEDMGMISSLYKIPLKNMTEFGDTVNWLDDNAQSKGGEIINVMKRIAGVATLVNMNFKEAAALGSTFLSLGAGQQIAATATNAMINRLANAPVLQNEKRYAQGLNMLGLSADKLQKSMTTNATGTIIDVLERIKKLSGDKQLEAATRLFGVEYGDDASKLAQNLKEYRRQLQLTNDVQAKGSMNREFSARNSSQEAQLQMAQDFANNTSASLGERLKPALLDVLNLINPMIRGIRDWVKENPVLTSSILKVIAVLSLITIAVGGLLLIVAGILGPMIAFKFALGFLSIKGIALMPILKGIGTVLLWLGRILLANPIIAFATAIGAAVFLIYKYWEPITAFFDNLWTGITKRFFSFISKIKSVLASIGKYIGLGGDSTMTLATAGAGGANTPVVKSTTPVRSRYGKSSPVTHAPVFNVHAAPGMDENALAKMVADKVDASNRKAAQAHRSNLADKD